MLIATATWVDARHWQVADGHQGTQDLAVFINGLLQVPQSYVVCDGKVRFSEDTEPSDIVCTLKAS